MPSRNNMRSQQLQTLLSDVKQYVDRWYKEDAFDDLLPPYEYQECKCICLDLSVPDLESLLDETDAGFSESLLQFIARSGKTNSEVYTRANIDRKLFSKIKNNPNYTPKKHTVLAFAIALELNLDDTMLLLERAGYALTHASKFDIIIEYFIKQGIYDMFLINDTLYEFDQPLIGTE